MNKGLKAILVIGCILLLSVLLPVVLVNNPYVNQPFGLTFQAQSISAYYLSQYLFWVALIFMIMIICLILVILFYPSAQSSFVLKEDHGTLTLDKRAIEGFVKAKLSEKEFIGIPRVMVNATKNKIKIKVRGKLKRTSTLIHHTEWLMEEIERDLQQTLGSEEKVKVEVRYTGYEEPELAAHPRVE